jgi:hypothetical protein
VTAPGDFVAKRISDEGLSIYDDLSDRPNCFYDIEVLESRLDSLLRGLNLDYAIRTRAKVAKTEAAVALGYPAPTTFAKTQPRFPGQQMDVLVQKANNLQIWNEEIDPGRRYALIRVDDDGIVTAVRVLTGEAIALLDTTGTLTSKFQAKRKLGAVGSRLVTESDTEMFVAKLHPRPDIPRETLSQQSPTQRPSDGNVLPISDVYQRLQGLVGVQFDDPGLVQDRLRGVELQRLACQELGLGPYADGGQFPDVLCQNLELKLQLSPTVDLGLVAPNSEALAQEVGEGLRHCDTRYAIAYGSRTAAGRIQIESVVATTGERFFEEFQRFEGLVENRKLQIPLPRDLFNAE